MQTIKFYNGKIRYYGIVDTAKHDMMKYLNCKLPFGIYPVGKKLFINPIFFTASEKNSIIDYKQFVIDNRKDRINFSFFTKKLSSQQPQAQTQQQPLQKRQKITHTKQQQQPVQKLPWEAIKNQKNRIINDNLNLSDEEIIRMHDAVQNMMGEQKRSENDTEFFEINSHLSGLNKQIMAINKIVETSRQDFIAKLLTTEFTNAEDVQKLKRLLETEIFETSQLKSLIEQKILEAETRFK